MHLQPALASNWRNWDACVEHEHLMSTISVYMTMICSCPDLEIGDPQIFISIKSNWRIRDVCVEYEHLMNHTISFCMIAICSCSCSDLETSNPKIFISIESNWRSWDAFVEYEYLTNTTSVHDHDLCLPWSWSKQSQNLHIYISHSWLILGWGFVALMYSH